MTKSQKDNESLSWVASFLWAEAQKADGSCSVGISVEMRKLKGRWTQRVVLRCWMNDSQRGAIVEFPLHEVGEKDLRGMVRRLVENRRKFERAIRKEKR